MKSESENRRGGWLRRNFLPLLTLFFVALASVAIFSLYQNYPEKLVGLKDYGYLGAFFASLLFNATVLLPAGNALVLAALGALLPSPLLVGIVAGLGATIGELSGYMAGMSGRKILGRSRLYVRVEEWLKRWGVLTILLLSVAPVFFDLAGLAAGVGRFPLWKFLLFCFLGRTLFYIVVAFAGAYGWEALLRLIG